MSTDIARRAAGVREERLPGSRLHGRSQADSLYGFSPAGASLASPGVWYYGKSMKLSKPVRADIALIVATFVWGGTFVVVKQSLALVSPVLLVALRFWLATLVIVILIPAGLRNIPRTTLLQGTALSLVLTGGLIFQTIGLVSTEPSYSAFITSLSVLLVPLLGVVIYKHRPRPQTIAGVMLAVPGLFLLLASRMSEFRIHTGELLTLAAAVLYGFQILFVGRFVSTSDYRQLMVLQMGGTAVFSTVAIPLIERPRIDPTPGLVLAIILTGVLATAFTYYVQVRAQRLTTANHAALIFSLEPFFAALFAFWIMGHGLTAREWIGGAFIVVGILASELQIPQAKRR